MLVTLICEEQIYGVLLPERVVGCYWVEDRSLENGDSDKKLLSIEGEHGIWKIFSGKKIRLYEADSTEEVPCLELEAGKMYKVELTKGRKGYIFTESYTQGSCTFKKYSVNSNTTINIGQNSNNQIIICNPYVSFVHAQLSLSGNIWTISDNNSKNGIYINEKRLRHSTIAHPGDTLYILGVKIVLGKQFLAVNNPNGMVKLDEKILTEYEQEPIKIYEMPEEVQEKLYYRSPEFRQEISPLKLKIDAPTMQEHMDDMPLALTLAPSLVMGTASFSSGIVTMMTVSQNGGNWISALPTFVMALAMLAGMVLFPFLMKKSERRKKKERELERRKKYLKYLENVRAEIYRASNRQKEILNKNYPLVLSQMKHRDFYDMRLWNRVIGQKDFLTVRLGIGNIPLQAELSFPEQRFRIDDDVMREEVNRMSKEKQMISGVPVVYSLVEYRVSGIVGNSRAVNGLLNHLMLQIAALHSYDEVKIVFLCDECNLKKYDYVRWMQHIWDDDFRIRFLATNPEEVRGLSAYFIRLLDSYRGEHAKKYPHYVVISTSKMLSDSCAFLAEILKDNALNCFSYLAVYDELKNLPKECTMITQVKDGQGMLYDYRTSGGGQINFVQDTVTLEDTAGAIMDIAEYRLDLRNGKYALPEMLTFLEMFKVGKYEYLNIASRWKESNPVLSLQTPVGVNADGDLFYLDLHEKAHGPHGLIAGMTGSGKSEFIITFVLSLAVNYSPEDVAFILIDYKGGGLVGAFDNEQYRLPHLAGTITNLDGTVVIRALLSIQSELRRRQKIFNEARQAVHEGTMDIYKYQKFYRNGVVSEPVPHLLIIADEFAELKSQEPEFMSQLISISRIGRSLGVHLILATQKPGGVVSEQIWANSKFKVCLKVQDRADSMEMLKRPDAAELMETGRFYLQVGYNELFEIGQSAWCGAPYVPMDTVEADVDERIQLIDHMGNVLEETRPQKKVLDSENAKKQIVEIVQYISQVAENEQLGTRPLWMPEIPAIVTVEYLEEKYQYEKTTALNPIIGELDDPSEQDQRILTLPLTQKGNAVCYGAAGSGKEGFLTAILYSLYRTYTAQELNAYILDFGAETLQMFEEAPQTGSFIISGEDEKIANLFRYLERETESRKKTFASLGEDYLTYCGHGNTDVPGIVVIINDYASFAEQYELLEERLTSFTRDCTKYGIYFIVTCISPVGIRYRMQQNFSQVFVLRMNEQSDYVAVLGNTGGVYPSRITGRGLYREKDAYEFQTASVAENPQQTVAVIKDFCKQSKETAAYFARTVPLMPKIVRQKHMEGIDISFENVPIGMDVDTVEPVCLNLKRVCVEQVLAMDRQDTVAFMEGLANLLLQTSDCECFVFDPEQLLTVEGIDAEHYITEHPEKAIVHLFDMTVKRHNEYKLAGGNQDTQADMHPVVVIFMGLGQIRRLLSRDGQDKLRLILEKTSGRYRLSFWAVDDYPSFNTYCAETWCSGNGIWIGKGIGEQISFKVNSRNLPVVKNQDCTDGFLIRRAKLHPVKLLISDRTDMEDEDE